MTDVPTGREARSGGGAIIGHALDRLSGVPLRWRIGPLVVVGLLSIYALFAMLGSAIAQDARQRTISGWLSVTSSTASSIDSQIDLQFQRLERMATLLGQAAGDPARQRQVVEDGLGGPDPLIDACFLLDGRGSVMWSRANDQSLLADHLAAHPDALAPLGTGQRYVSGVSAFGGRAAVILAVPVSGTDQRAAGVLGVVVRPDRGLFQQVVAGARGLARTGHAELVDQYGRVVASSDPGRVLGQGEHPDLYEPLLAERRSDARLSAPVTVDPADAGQRHVMAFVPLRSAPWGLALGGSDAELSADASRWQQQIALVGGLSLGPALLLVWLTTRNVARPIQALTAASRQIAAGDLETPIPRGGEGEVRELAEAFDHMRGELQRALAAEEQVSRLKDEFLSTVSHELRTPLGFITGYATTLLLPDAPSDEATRRHCIEVIADASKELGALVDDLLDMTKIAAGSLSVSLEPTRLRPLALAAVERIRVRGHGHRFSTDVPASLPLVRADAHRVEQVLYDLLDNAIKYSPDGGRIAVRARADGDAVLVSVLDQGLGIPPEELPTLFERFRRGRIARARAIGGTGLGLAICKGIVEAHGGRIWAESPLPPGRSGSDGRPGTAIRFTLPLAEAEVGSPLATDEAGGLS